MVYVIKVENGRALLYDSNGNCILGLGSPGVVSGQVQGNVVTITYENGRVEIYDTRGNCLRAL